MKIIKKPAEMQKLIKKYKLKGKTIGFVPTMGALHQGHISLIHRARKESNIIVVSIFVNPTQFGPSEDFSRYPRPFKKDAGICRKEKVAAVFVPKPKDIYPANYFTHITVEKLSDIMCGKSRPDHFKGVATVVAKLFNIVQPDRAYFGLKDYQQFIIIRKMAGDMNFPVKIIGCPLVREKNGLALSSRNAYLSGEQKQRALALSLSLQMAKNLIKNKNVKSAKSIISKIRKTLRPHVNKIDYVEIRDAETLETLGIVNKRAVIAAAIFIGKTRLIDNIIV
ncbi:MAG: pantoate--beta-alanine ligase [Elusimicrobia bacterium]|nr:pantoate--beta-alanine ligase [Elusimicrobiota bacterium]